MRQTKLTLSRLVSASGTSDLESEGHTWLRIGMDLNSVGGWFPSGEGQPQSVGRFGETLPRAQRERKRPERKQTTLHRQFHFLEVVNEWLFNAPVHPDTFETAYEKSHLSSRVRDCLRRCGAPLGWNGDAESPELRREILDAAFYLNILTLCVLTRFVYDAPHNARLGLAKEMLGGSSLSRGQLQAIHQRTWEVLIRRCGFLCLTGEDFDKPKPSIHLVMPVFRDQQSTRSDAQAIRLGVDGAIGSFFYFLALRTHSGPKLRMRRCEHHLAGGVCCGDLFVAVGNTKRCASHATTDPLSAKELKARQDRRKAELWNRTRVWEGREALLRSWHGESPSVMRRIYMLRQVLGGTAASAAYHAYRKAWSRTNKV